MTLNDHLPSSWDICETLQIKVPCELQRTVFHQYKVIVFNILYFLSKPTPKGLCQLLSQIDGSVATITNRNIVIDYIQRISYHINKLKFIWKPSIAFLSVLIYLTNLRVNLSHNNLNKNLLQKYYYLFHQMPFKF